jgi:uridine kinase
VQRTPERFAQVGGNVDYERFYDEVLLPLKSGEAFSYRPFDCGSFTLAESVAVTPKKLNIVEGTYSRHPYFGDPYDLKILLTVDEETQRQRILKRPAFLHSRFFEEWIPMENRYFEALQE